MEKISTGDKLDVVVTSVESVSAIFATLSENGLALMELQDALMNRYSILPSNQTYSPQVGEICATKFVDNYWYRGRILAVNGSKVKVLYVDYGNQEVISVTDCHPLSKYLLKLDEQLVTCSLANSRGKDVMKSVKDLEETRIKIQVSGKVNGILMIELLTGDNTKTESKSPLLPTPSQDSPTKFQEKSSPVMRQGYSNTTPQERSPSSSNQDSYRQRSTYNNRSPMNGDVKSPENYGNQEQRGKNSYRNDGKTSTYNGYQHQPSNFQKFNNQNIPPSPVMAEKCEMMSLKEGKIETAMIYVANGPSSFYVQVNQPTSVRAIQQISDPMSEDYSNIKEVHLPVVGELCIAKFSDDYWYRAEVLSIGTNKLNVKFIDYGNIDPVKKEDVRRIKEPYSKIPVVAIHCALHGAPITDNPKDKQSQEFAEKFVNKVVGVKRVGITPKGVSLVEIFDKKGSNRPINADYIVPVQSPKQVDKNVPTVVFRELELQCETKATVMYVVSPSEFYCTRVEGDILALKNLMESLNIRYANKGKNYDYVPRKGEMCCSIFAEDQSWYRALVLDVNVDNQCASVQYVDYGNKAKVAFDSVHPLDKEFSTTPCLAIKCCLAGTRPDQGSAWSEGAIERVKDVLGQGEKLLHIKLMSHDDGWNYIEVADPTTNEVLNKVFQNASPVTGIHDTPLSSHRPAFLPSPSTDTDALLLEKYEQKKRELEELQNMLQKH
ncbi:tudor domain-containing protein 1-like isoform X3 [Antedon mediterranea]|uniref:tudor domain-containing protein 1-like isoform X3 n=1 Tax=Antedon mediterranea TaxID=105859 RepID=UPI003AF99927